MAASLSRRLQSSSNSAPAAKARVVSQSMARPGHIIYRRRRTSNGEEKKMQAAEIALRPCVLAEIKLRTSAPILAMPAGIFRGVL